MVVEAVDGEMVGIVNLPLYTFSGGKRVKYWGG
jgi:hypothetical protein